MKSIYKLHPFFSEKIWGWEKWNLSCHPNGLSTLPTENNTPLVDLLKENQSYLADNFPILIKIIQANQALSIQVHPQDDYAKKFENSYGKSECWYILDAEPDAEIIVNFKEKVTPEKLRSYIKENTLEDKVERLKVRPGNFIYIPAGTIHAIGGGIRLLEIQQSSDITYRVYDYNRGRELHIDQSIEVTDYPSSDQNQLQADLNTFTCPYFQLERHRLAAGQSSNFQVKDDSFSSVIITGGRGELLGTNKEEVKLENEGSAILFPGSFQITNHQDQDLEWVRVTVNK